MQKRILDFFKNDRSYNGAIELYRQIGKRMTLKRFLYLLPESEMKDMLFDELREMAGISLLEFGNLLMTPVVTPFVTSTANEKIECSSEKRMKVSSSTCPMDGVSEEVSDVPLQPAPSICIEDEFPFLCKADCPTDLHKLITAFLSVVVVYNDASSLQGTVPNGDQPQELTTNVGISFKNGTVEPELNFCKTNLQGYINPTTVDFYKQIQLLQPTTYLYLYNLKKRLINNLSQNKLNLSKYPTHSKTSKILQREKQMKNELALVNYLLKP